MSAPEAEDLREWIRSYTPQLLGVARAFAHGPDEAEDILQEVWIAAYSKAHRRSAETPVGAWLYTIALNEGRMRLRRRMRRERLRELWSSDLSPVEDTTVSRSIGADLGRSRLWQAVARLPSLQRKVVLLRIVDEMSTRETAEALNRAEGTVKASLHRALRALKQELESAGASVNSIELTEE